MPLTSRNGLGSWRRVTIAVGGALKRWLLGKSGHDYMKRFAAGDEYWDNALTSQHRWSRQLSPKPEERKSPGGNPAC